MLVRNQVSKPFLTEVASRAGELYRAARTGRRVSRVHKHWLTLDEAVITHALYRIQAPMPSLALSHCKDRQGPPAVTRFTPRRPATIIIYSDADGSCPPFNDLPSHLEHSFAGVLMLRWFVVFHELGHVLLSRMRNPLRLPANIIAAPCCQRLNAVLFNEMGAPATPAGVLFHEIFADLIATQLLLDTGRCLRGAPFGALHAHRVVDIIRRRRLEEQRRREQWLMGPAELSMDYAHETGVAIGKLLSQTRKIQMPKLRTTTATMASQEWLRRFSPATALTIGGRIGHARFDCLRVSAPGIVNEINLEAV